MSLNDTTHLPRPLKDETGKRYGRLIVLDQAPVPEHIKEKRQAFWRCRCDCGNIIVTCGSTLRRGDSVSCGCYNRDYEAKRGKKPTRFNQLPEYDIWNHIKRRCHNPNDDNYSRYGKRGITVCDEWRDSFEAFYRHVGPRPSPSHTIDRIDNDLGYFPGNVRWATRREQANNRRDTIHLVFQGKTQSLTEWARELGIPYVTVRSRYHAGMTAEQILSVGHFTSSQRRKT